MIITGKHDDRELPIITPLQNTRYLCHYTNVTLDNVKEEKSEAISVTGGGGPYASFL
jgi:hypothetical protein